MRQSKLLSVILATATAVFLLTGSIALPILLRPFYYAHITPLALEQTSGLDRGQIVTAYDEMMDFCTGRTAEFSTGILPWSAAGREHFVDVRGLFRLDLTTAAISGLFLLGWAPAGKACRIQPYRFRNRGFAFWGCIGLGGFFLIIGTFSAVNFHRAFLLFHRVFFPGKSNWVFYSHTDGIIRILPQAFFRNCALLILITAVLLCCVIILSDLRRQ